MYITFTTIGNPIIYFAVEICGKNEITQFVRGQVVGMFQAGKSFRDIVSAIENISRSTVGKIIAKWKSTQVIPRSGRPSIITSPVLRSLKRIVRSNRRDSTFEITSKLAETIPHHVSAKKERYSCCTATHKPLISKIDVSPYHLSQRYAQAGSRKHISSNLE